MSSMDSRPIYKQIMPLWHNFDISNVLVKSQQSIPRCTVRTKQMVLNNIQKCQAKISISYLKLKSAYESSGPSGRLLSGTAFRGYFCSRLDGMLVDRGVAFPPPPFYPSIKLACTHLYTWVKKVTVKVKSFVQSHNAQKPTRARTITI